MTETYLSYVIRAVLSDTRYILTLAAYQRHSNG